MGLAIGAFGCVGIGMREKIAKCGGVGVVIMIETGMKPSLKPAARV